MLEVGEVFALEISIHLVCQKSLFIHSINHSFAYSSQNAITYIPVSCEYAMPRSVEPTLSVSQSFFNTEISSLVTGLPVSNRGCRRECLSTNIECHNLLLQQS